MSGSSADPAPRHPRLCMVLIDGIADVSYDQLQGRTPLQAAHTPCMDELARTGIVGLMDPVQPGLACGSDTAHLSIFGYPPQQFYRGRGAFESMGAGLDMLVGDIAFKSNFATLETSKRWVISRRADRDFTPYGPVLCDFLTENCLDLGSYQERFRGYSVCVKYSTEHRCGVRIRGPGLSDEIEGTDPLRDDLPLVTSVARADSTEARFTADLVNFVSDLLIRLLETHPINKQRADEGKQLANCVLLRGAGVRIKTEPFKFLRPDCVPVMIAPTACIRGLGLCLGMEILVPDGATGDYHSNLLAKSSRCIELFQQSEPDTSLDFVFLHVKCVDDSGHDGDVRLKMQMLERCDKMVAHLVEALPSDVAICITGDHSTPCSFADHSHEPVPFLISRFSASYAEQFADDVQTFDELAARNGVLGRFLGQEAMPLLRQVVLANAACL